MSLGATLGKTVAHFFPEMPRWIKRITDTRDQTKIIYPREFLTWMGILLFTLKLGSRRQLRFELDSPEALANLNLLSGCRMSTMAHSDTLDHFLSHASPESMHELRHEMVARLIRMKVLDKARLYGYLLVVIDGTGRLFFRERHCPHCLEKKVNGQTQYYHHVLEAKLVTPEGLVFSIGTEFIENHDPQATKQDCELKAFERLARRLKADFPQLQLCLCLDALYANGTTLSILETYNWKYFITFKQGSLPVAWAEYQALRDMCPDDRKVVSTTSTQLRQEFAWVRNLEHRDDRKRPHALNVIECVEWKDDQEPGRFVWLTNFNVDRENVATLANYGGRLRWKIENEGFNIQKNGGFNLEHDYSAAPYQSKHYYLLMQIAHMILQLLEHGSLLSRAAKKLFGSIRNLARRLAESIRNHLISAEAVDPNAAAEIQIRLNTS